MQPEPDPSLHLRRLQLRGDAAAIRELIDALERPELASQAASALSDLQAVEAAPALIDRVRTAQDPAARANCAYALGHLQHPDVFPTLIEAIQDPSPLVFQSVIGALGILGDQRAVPYLKPLLDRPEWDARRDVCTALLELSCADAEVGAAIERLGNEPDSDTAGFTVDNLRRTFAQIDGGVDEESELDLAVELQEARRQLSDERAEVRAYGAHRLRAVGGLEAVQLLIEALGDRSTHVRGSAALALGSLEAPEAVPELLHLMQSDASDHVRLMCTTAFWWRADPRAFGPLVAALHAEDWKMVTSACRGLERLGDPRAASPLLALLEHSQWRIRLAACETLLNLKIPDGRVVKALRRMAAEPEAEEYDLRAAESVRDLPMMREFAEEGDPEPQPLPTMAELIQQAEQLLNAT